ncbi:MAG: patatin-like phospholipase family protein [Salinisphaeraceae bacterium]|nr:patatin-like phospholipase family protein [Salinisphaeraceae bacterium]
MDRQRANDEILLSLQYLEQSILRALHKMPGFLTPSEVLNLRYTLRFASLKQFGPGAAKGQEGSRGDVDIAPETLAGLRSVLLNEMAPRMARAKSPRRRLLAAARSLPELKPLLLAARQQLLECHVNDFSEQELDDEIAHKKLVLIAGGGGGAGYVYTGAMARLQVEGLVPDYIVGSSIGALQGAFWARDKRPDYQGFFDFAKTLTPADVFDAPSGVSRYSFPGMLRLHLAGLESELSDADGNRLQIRDMAIPYEVVVAGVQASILERMPSFLSGEQTKGRRAHLRSVLAKRAWQLTTLITPNLLDEVVLGRDEQTAEFEVLEAAGFSAAIPGVIQFDPRQRSRHMHHLVANLCKQRELMAIVDGGVANNVPAKAAWRGVQGGKLGSRNAFYLALDCFTPQTHYKQLLLWPVTQAVQLQMPANRAYFDWLQQFKPTLSPANLLPNPTDFDLSWAWGWEQMSAALPVIKKSLEPLDLAALHQPTKARRESGKSSVLPFNFASSTT